MSECHIRDFLATTDAELKEGKPSTKTLCGLEDPQMNRLTYGDADSVVKGAVAHPCEKCVRAWRGMVDSISDQKRARAKFHRAIAKSYRFNPLSKGRR